MEKATFWEHLDELRAVIIRVAIVLVAATLAAFFFKDALFSAILAPKENGFITYRWIESVASQFSLEKMDKFSVELINTQLSQQFILHIRMSLYAGVVVVFPYLLYELFRFVSPALYAKERHYTKYVIFFGYLLFLFGAALSYFLIFPLTFRFLATYQVSSEVQNLISLDSYIETMMLLNLSMGIIFEIPILCWLFAKLGFLTADYMRKYRRHAVVLLLFIAAIITPTSDVVTLLLVATPIYLLFELSILLVAATKPKVNL